MPALMPPQTVLTPADAGNQLQTEGLDALGLSVPSLSSGWADADPGAADVDDDALRLTLTNPRAPFSGVLQVLAVPSAYSDVAGTPLSQPAAVLRLHPEAARRLAALFAARLGAPLQRPVPVAMLVHGVAVPATPQPLNWRRAGEALGFPGPHAVSFHDARGLPIDPLAVAALCLDLLGFRPALRFGDAAMPALGAAGALDHIVGVAAGLPAAAVRVHVIDPHGRAFDAARDAARLKLLDAGNAEQSVVSAALVGLPAGQRLGRSAADDSAEFAHGAFDDRIDLVHALCDPLHRVGLPRERYAARKVALDGGRHHLGRVVPRLDGGFRPALGEMFGQVPGPTAQVGDPARRFGADPREQVEERARSLVGVCQIGLWVPHPATSPHGLASR